MSEATGPAEGEEGRLSGGLGSGVEVEEERATGEPAMRPHSPEAEPEPEIPEGRVLPLNFRRLTGTAQSTC